MGAMVIFSRWFLNNYFWDKKEEALILVNWKNKKLWKSISMSEVNVINKNLKIMLKML